MTLYVAICPTFDHKFAFEAKDAKEADDLITKWNRYHSFSGDPEAEHRVEEITEEEMPGLRISLHNEYIHFLI